MNVENFIRIRVPLYSKAREYCLGKGVIMYLDDVCDALILFIHDEFQKNPSCILGDIHGLLLRKKEIDQKKDREITYQQHLIEQVRNGVYK